MAKQGMNEETVEHNILHPHRGFPGFKWDPKSIMNYGFPKDLIEEPQEYKSGLPVPEGFSEQDKELAQKFYPIPPKENLELSVEQGGMLNVKLRKDETKIIHLQFKSSSSQFHVSSLVANPSSVVEIVLKKGQLNIAKGLTNSAPLKGNYDASQGNDWYVELKPLPSPDHNEIPVTVIVF